MHKALPEHGLWYVCHAPPQLHSGSVPSVVLILWGSEQAIFIHPILRWVVSKLKCWSITRSATCVQTCHRHTDDWTSYLCFDHH